MLTVVRPWPFTKYCAPGVLAATVYGDPNTSRSTTRPRSSRPTLWANQGPHQADPPGPDSKGGGSQVCLPRYFNPVGAHISDRIGGDPNRVPNNLLPSNGRVTVGRQRQPRRCREETTRPTARA